MTKEEEERGGRSGPKIDAKESGQHLQAESKTDGETDGRMEDVGAAGGRRGTDGRRGKGGERAPENFAQKTVRERERGREEEELEELKFLAWRCSC